MDLQLHLGDRAYSSWSMRAGLIVDRFDLPVAVTVTPMRTPAFTALLQAIAPARTVPALQLPGGPVIAESLAIVEELAARFPVVPIWPTDARARAVARALAAEMHAGFASLRRACPMNLRRAYTDVPVEPAVRADLQRLEAIWQWARDTTGGPGPWLCGDWSAADAFFAPVAARIAGYGLPVAGAARDYVNAHLSESAFRAWAERGRAEGPDQTVYDQPWPPVPWPDRLGP